MEATCYSLYALKLPFVLLSLMQNVSIAIVGQECKLQILDNDQVQPYVSFLAVVLRGSFESKSGRQTKHPLAACKC